MKITRGSVLLPLAGADAESPPLFFCHAMNIQRKWWFRIQVLLIFIVYFVWLAYETCLKIWISLPYGPGMINER